MRAFLRRWFGWLAVPQPPQAAPPDADGPLPPGLYAVPAGMTITGFEPLSFFRSIRVGDAQGVRWRAD